MSRGVRTGSQASTPRAADTSTPIQSLSPAGRSPAAPCSTSVAGLPLIASSRSTMSRTCCETPLAMFSTRPEAPGTRSAATTARETSRASTKSRLLRSGATRTCAGAPSPPPASSCAATWPRRLAVGVPAPMTFDNRSTTASASPARTARRTARLPLSLVRP